MIINIYGSPGCGKSTIALGITSTLKKRGEDAEYVGEYVKNLIAAHGGSHTPIFNQLDILLNQNKLLKSFSDSCDYVVTDGALLNTNVYIEFNKDTQIEFCKEEIKTLCVSLDKSYKEQYNILVTPCKDKNKYKDSLRNYNFEDSKNLHKQISSLREYDYIVEDFFQYGADLDSLCDEIVQTRYIQLANKSYSKELDLSFGE